MNEPIDRREFLAGAAATVLTAATPLREPIVQCGPFVMNTEDEIRQAFIDYRNGSLAM